MPEVHSEERHAQSGDGKGAANCDDDEQHGVLNRYRAAVVGTEIHRGARVEVDLVHRNVTSDKLSEVAQKSEDLAE